MPAPIFTTHKRIIAEQPERINLTHFIKGNFANETTFAWTPGFTPPAGVTLDTTDTATLIIGPSVSPGYQETPLKLTATHAYEGVSHSTATTLTLVTLTPIAKIKQVASSSDTYITHLYIAGTEIEPARIIGHINFTNSIDANFLNQFTVSAVKITLDNRDNRFGFLAPRNFFAEQGLPHTGKNAPVRIAMGYDTASPLGEITRTVFCGRIHEILYNPDATVSITVFNLVTDIVNSTVSQNPLSLDISILPLQKAYDLTGSAYDSFTFVPNTLAGTWTDSTGTTHAIHLVNAFDENSTGFHAIQTAESIDFAANRPTGSTFRASIDIQLPTFSNIASLERLLTERDVPNQRIQQTTASQSSFLPITFIEDSAFNQQLSRFGKPSSIAMGQDGETVFCLTNNTTPPLERPRLFKVHLPTRRFTLLHEFGTNDFVGNLFRSTDRLLFCLKSRRNIPSTKDNARQFPVTVTRFVLDAQDNVTVTDNPYPSMTAGYQHGSVQYYPLGGSAIPNQPDGLVFKDVSSILSVLNYGRHVTTREHYLSLNTVRARDGANIDLEVSPPLSSIGAAWVSDWSSFFYYQTDYRYRDSRGHLYSNRRGYAAGIRWRNRDTTYSLHTSTNVRSLLNESRGVLYAFAPYVAVRPLNAAGQPIYSPNMARRYCLCGSATGSKRLYVLRERLSNVPVDINRVSNGRGYRTQRVRSYSSQNTLTYMWQDRQTHRIFCIETHGTGTDATSHIYRIDDDGTTTTFVKIESFPTLGNATWLTQLAVAAPVMYQNSPLFYCGWTGEGADIGFGKSFIAKSTDIISKTGASTTLIEQLNTAAISRFMYWYFDVERLVFRQKALPGTHTFRAYANGVIRYTTTTTAAPPASGQVFINGIVCNYTSRGAVTVNSVTYPTLGGVTPEPDAAHWTDRLVPGMPLVFISDVLEDRDTPSVLTSTFQTETLQRIERIQVKPINGTARLPVQVSPGDGVTTLDVAILPFAENTLADLETQYRDYFSHAALSIQLTLRPRYHLKIGDTVLLRLTTSHRLTTLATIVSITYGSPTMAVQVKTFPTGLPWVYPQNYQYPVCIAYHADRLYTGRVNALRAAALSNTTGEYLSALEDALPPGNAPTANTFNAGVADGYLYIAYAEANTRYIARMNIGSPGVASVLTLRWRRVPGAWNIRALAVDGDGGLWTQSGSQFVKLTGDTTLSPGTERLAIPAGVTGQSFTWYGGYFWGVGIQGSGDSQQGTLIGFRAGAGGTVETVTYAVPLNMVQRIGGSGNRLARGGLARGRVGWYFVENGHIYLYPDAVSGFNPADFDVDTP